MTTSKASIHAAISTHDIDLADLASQLERTHAALDVEAHFHPAAPCESCVVASLLADTLESLKAAQAPLTRAVRRLRAAGLVGCE